MKKLFVLSVVAAMVLTMGAGLSMNANAASAGDLIKMDGNPAVYYLGSDGKRYVFPNEATFKTWYKDFSSVVTVSKSELESYMIGGNVTFRAGTWMVKITTDPKVYAVEPGGVLRWVTTEAIAKSLYGDNWNKKIKDVSDAFFVNYTIGSDLTAATYPEGTLVKQSGSATTYYIDENNNKRPVASETAFSANGFNWDFVVTATSLAGYADGSSITAKEADMSTTAGPGSGNMGGNTTSTGTLTVALASDTPSSTTIVKNATWVKFTKVNLTATGGDVVVDSFQIKRTGLSQDANFSNVYIIDESTGLMHDTEKSLNSTHTAYVTKDMTIKAGTTKTISVAATMASTLYAGEVAGLALNEVNVKGNATVSGTLPLEGNNMTMNSTISIGGVTQAAGGSNPSTASKPVGTTNYVFAAAKLTVDSTEDVQLESIKFYQAGTASDSDVANLELVVDGAVLATVANPVDKEVLFNLSASPYTIKKGINKTFEVRGDIVDGSGRTIEFEFDKKTDIRVKGKTYGYYITPTYATSQTSSPYWNNTSYTTVSTGTLTVSKATMSSTSVAEGATQQTLGQFYFNAQGEPIIITQVVMNVQTSTQAGAVTNITVYDEDGDVVAGPADPTTGSDPDTITLSDTFTVPVGIHTYVVKADLDTNWSANDTIYFEMNSITAKGEVTNNSVTASPTTLTNVDGDTVTVKIGALSVSTSSSPAAQVVTAGTSGFTFANFVLDATQSGENVKVTQLLIKHTSSAANIHNYITGITLYDGATALNTPQSGENSTSISTATSTITLTSPLIITRGTAKTITLKGDISGSAAADSTHKFGLTSAASITSYGVDTGNEITETVTASDGQLMTIAAGGTLRMSNAGSNPTSGLVVADATNQVGVFNFEALYENIEVQRVGLTISGTANTYKNVDWLQLYDGSTKLGEIQVTGANATITPSELIIPQNGSKTLTLKAVTQKVGALESGTSGQTFTVTITGMDVKGKATGSTTITKSGLNSVATNAQYIFKTKPTVTQVSLSGMANGNQDLYKFTLAADSKGDLGFYKASFAITTSSATVTNFKLYEISGGAETDLSQTALDAGEIYTANTNNAGGKFVVNAVVDDNSSTGTGAKEYTIVGAGSSKTYVLRGDVTGWDSNASIQVQMMGDDAVPSVQNTDGVEDDASDNFIWSDLFYGWSSSSATLTAEWVNGYKVFATTTQSF